MIYYIMHDTTYHGLFCWSKEMFEKFGWMTLAHRDRDYDHIKSYAKNIAYLISHIDKKIENLEKLIKVDKNSSMKFKIDELKILKDNVLVLHSHALKMAKK